jgi:NAD-dependent SIR2 family protein deacetylase
MTLPHWHGDVKGVIPEGIKPTDHWHVETNDNTCSRCRHDVPEDDVPLILWSDDGNDMLIYCPKCMGWEPPLDEEAA